MRDEPPQHLIDLLARLHLATAEQVRAARRRARGLARGLPLMESAWVDALARAKVLTRFQANELNAGRGEKLLVGGYVIQKQLHAARNWTTLVAIDSVTKRVVHLTVDATSKIDVNEPDTREQVLNRRVKTLKSAIEQSRDAQLPAIAKPLAAGIYEDRAWAVYEPTDGFPLIDWVSSQGRVSPVAVLEIARQLLTAFATAELAQVLPCSISVESVLLDDDGTVRIASLGFVDKESTGESSFATLGQLIWHLLSGRSPVGQFPHIRHFVPDAPRELVELIEQCADTRGLNLTFSELAAVLGPSTEAGRRMLVAELLKSRRATLRRGWKEQTRQLTERAGGSALAVAACVFLLAAATSPLWRGKHATVNQETAVAAAKPVAVAPNGPQQRSPINDPAPNPVRRRDPEVRTASYQTDQPRPQPAARSEPKIIELAGDKEISASTLRLEPGAIVRGSEQNRPRVVVPASGLIVSVDRVRFENIDFIWRTSAEQIFAPDTHAIINLRAARIQFDRCTFQAQATGSFELPAAIRVGGGTKAALGLTPSTSIQAERCVFQGVDCGLRAGSRGPISIVLKQCLYLGKGALARFPEPIAADATATVALDATTVRGADSIVAASCETTGIAGSISIAAVSCVFQTDEAGALVTLRSSRSPIISDGLLKCVDWSGQGSLVTPGTHIATWQHDDLNEPLPEADLPFEGLATSELQFAGAASEDPADSRLKRWLGPVKSAEAPGIPDGMPRLPPIAAAQR
jgi:hypothetical protein